MLIPEGGTVTMNVEIHIDPRMPADKLNYIIECMEKYIFAPPRADTEARNIGRRTAERITQLPPSSDRRSQ